MKLAMLLLAAGRATRFGGAVPKPYVPLAGKPVLLRSAEALRRVPTARDQATLCVIVSPEHRKTHLRRLLPALEALGAVVVDGGDSRQESMRRGLAAAPADCDLVLVHDAARPLFDPAAARRCLAGALEVGAALLATPVTDTLKRVDAAGQVQGTVDRAGIWAAQTPQVARRGLLVAALDHADCHGLQATDDMGLIEAVGGRVAVVESSPRNLKITHPIDLTIAAALLAWSGDDGAGPAPERAGDAPPPAAADGPGATAQGAP